MESEIGKNVDVCPVRVNQTDIFDQGHRFQDVSTIVLFMGAAVCRRRLSAKYRV